MLDNNLIQSPRKQLNYVGFYPKVTRYFCRNNPVNRIDIVGIMIDLPVSNGDLSVTCSSLCSASQYT